MIDLLLNIGAIAIAIVSLALNAATIRNLRATVDDQEKTILSAVTQLSKACGTMIRQQKLIDEQRRTIAAQDRQIQLVRSTGGRIDFLN